MIQAARSVGGSPPHGYRSLEECFTYEPALGVLILWYNVRGNTRVEVRPVEKATLRPVSSL